MSTVPSLTPTVYLRGKLTFGLRSEETAREFPLAFDIVRDRVKPDRDANPREVRRTYWWRFGEPNPGLREMSSGLSFVIVTPETAKHRFFCALETTTAPDNMLVCIASSDLAVLGVLSSAIHTEWALAAGSRLGVGNDPRYNKTLCFDPFPFPDPSPDLRKKIGDVAERLDAHRKSAIARDERVTMTGMYNVVEKLRSGEALTPKERAIHEIAACGILRDLHDELDRLVAEAYGWPWPMEREEILERLVALHDERVEEEKRGIIRWLRPEYQIPRFAPEQAAQTLALEETAKPANKKGGKKKAKAEANTVEAAKPSAAPWPATAVEQISAIAALIAQQPRSSAEVAAAFTGARADLVARHLETLSLMGELTVGADGRYRSARFAA